MRFTDVLAASLVAPLVAAHGGILGMPKIFGLGRSGPTRLRAERGLENSARKVAQKLQARQGGLEGRCGPEAGGASCAPGYCCSGAGWCGIGDDYCMAPDCLFEYGSGCDANKLPSGGTTREIARPQLGSVPYGEGIYDCIEPGTVAITYDDGPYIYTNDVLDQFAAYGFKATFFVTGININKGSIDDESKPWPAMLRRMVAEGHQIASHTWSHQNLDQITQEQRIEQMVRNEMAISNVIGKFPTYMRPPYSACVTPECEADMKDLGYVISFFDLDTDDYQNTTPDLIQNAKNNFANAINPSNPASDEFLAIAHDIHQQTAQNLTGYMLDLLVAKGYRGITMGECMGEPEANWYRTGEKVATTTSEVPVPSSTTSSVPFPTATGATTDGTCGAQNGMSCIGYEAGSCCSQAGWCGVTTDHCGSGCQEGFGTCGSSSSSLSSVVATATSSSESSSVASGTESSTVASSTEASSTEASSTVASTTSSAPTTTPTVISVDGSCGGDITCVGSEFGNCCSQYGYCGSTELYCGEGCKPLFGNCGSEASSSLIASSTAAAETSSASETASSTVEFSTEIASSTEVASSTESAVETTSATSIDYETEPTLVPSETASPTESTVESTSAPAQPTSKPPTYGKKSQDGTCGGEKGYSCKGFRYGECCSQYGWCGSTRDHCKKRSCNPLFGKCGDRYIKNSYRYWG